MYVYIYTYIYIYINIYIYIYIYIHTYIYKLDEWIDRSVDCRYIHLCPVSIYLSKVNNRNTGTKFEICSKLIIKIIAVVPLPTVHFSRCDTLFWCFHCCL